jgi:hypothetical protein
LVVASAAARTPAAPPRDWWPAASRLLLGTIDDSDASVRAAGCSAFVAMGLVKSCRTWWGAGVLPDDVTRLRAAVRCLGTPECPPTGPP